MTTKQQQVVRLKKELKALLDDPIPNIVAIPSPKNILEWHYVIFGPKGTPYEGGFYHGKIMFPSDYPYKPPSILMLTPSGRFTPNKRICLSMSDYHPETWNPLWSVGSILTGLLSFMLEETPTAGSISSTLQQKRLFASKSMKFNLTNPTFRKLFPELCEGHSQSNENNSNNTTTTTENTQAKNEVSKLMYGVVFFVIIAIVFAMKTG